MKRVTRALAGWLAATLLLLMVLPIPTAARTRCVNPEGTSGCFASIKDAISASSAGDVINVAAGTYAEDITLKAGVQVIGAGAGSSIIQGTGGLSYAPAPVVKATDRNIGTDTLLQGFTLTGGNANVTVHSFGGGVHIEEGASPTIRDNLITGNRATLGGGIAITNGSNPMILSNTITANSSVNAAGIYVQYSSPTIVGNQITDNQATEGAASGGGQGGGLVIIFDSFPVASYNTISGNVSSCDGGGVVVQDGAQPTVSHNTIEDNQATGEADPYCGVGGGLKYFQDAGGTLEGNIIRSNTALRGGGGMHLEGNSTPLIDRNKILNNDGGLYGGGLVTLLDSNSTISNNYIAGNKATLEGGGMHVNSSSPEIRNNTIVANNEVGGGEGMFIWPTSAAPTIVNNIIVNNNYGIARAAGDFRGVVDYNDVWNNVIRNYEEISAGPHDISADPLFVGAAVNNYALQRGSPAVDAGTNKDAPGTDINGWVRPHDGDGDGRAIVDMGAHELQPEGPHYYIHLPIVTRGWTDQ